MRRRADTQSLRPILYSIHIILRERAAALRAPLLMVVLVERSRERRERREVGCGKMNARDPQTALNDELAFFIKILQKKYAQIT